MIRILSNRVPYIRCGHHHLRQADYPDDHFTDEELARFNSDPVLTVVRIEPGAEVNPAGDITLDQRIQAAITDMLTEDPKMADKDLWTKGGKPEVAAIEKRLGEDITAAMRDTAWTAVKAVSVAE